MLIKNLFRYWTYQVFSPGTILREKYESFKALLEHDKAAHEFMATLEEIYYTQKKCDFQVVVKNYGQFAHSVSRMVEELLKMCPSRYWSLKAYFKKFDFYVRFMLAPPEFEFSPPFIMAFKSSPLTEAVAGKKAFSLEKLNRELHLPCPDGFVITTNAFHYFIEYNNLQKPINEQLADLDISIAPSLEQTAREIKELILNACIPQAIEIAVTDAINSLERTTKTTNCRFAIRSSGVKEDGKASFAGQYQTILNVEKKKVLNGYKRVIASKYSAQALFYRISHGILDHETPMAVLVLEMINAKASGVIYTRDLENRLYDQLSIHSVWGQGSLLVDGKVSPDVIKVSQKNPNHILSINISTQQKQTVSKSETHTRTVAANQDRENLLSLDKQSALTLARWGMLLETHFNQPQDIEWCQDQSGKLFILQSRPLNIHPTGIRNHSKKIRSIENKILCSKGESACPGVASGSIYILEHLAQLPHVPNGSVLVVRHALPQLVTRINQIKAVVAGTGSRAGHFSSIAREFGIPTIVNVGNGLHDLVHGNQVTVDADRCIVYEGKVKHLMEGGTAKEKFFKESSFMTKLRYVLDFSAQLKLTDPENDSFMPEKCRSLHDIIRFTHETAVQEMFSIGTRKGTRKKGAQKLISDIPMLFYLLDVGQGIKDKLKNEKIVRVDDILSIPMKAVLKGLLNPGICWSETTHFDWQEYDKIVMAGGIISADSPRFGSYAVLSDEYLNINLRFGYHFAILDTICSSIEEDNYILFRFSGGGGTPDGRALRADFIKGILTQLGFMVKIKSDLVDAEFKYGSLTTTQNTLDMIGRLLGATKLMDMYLKNNVEIKLMIDDFMNGQYDFRSISGDKRL